MRLIILFVMLSLSFAIYPSLPAVQADLEEDSKEKQKHTVVVSVVATAAAVGCFVLPGIRKICGDKMRHLLRSADDSPKTVNNATGLTSRARQAAPHGEEVEHTAYVKRKETLNKEVIAELDLHKIVYQEDIKDNIVRITANTHISRGVDELLEVGNIQEIIWKLREEGFFCQSNGT